MRLSSNFGMSRLAVLLWVLLLACGVYFGSQVVTYYYGYIELKSQMEAMAEKAQVKSDSEIRRFLWSRVKELGIPLEAPDEIQINRTGGKITISTYWEDAVYFELEDYYYELYVFDFNPIIEKKF